ncbi:MAG: PDZ domain-containing protein [Gammaproteobacteria bacterium]|jgi:C-terminal processing protease CtpA/Prc|nr:PDZ domain-containing protein [Gammaproteobacteria bacterium]MDH3819721.1 PDZ domain-containing protein [Gammaproteobacteria bacterium]MDH3906934.1 PDZ domain-containing protein [Gammaproteobacteria bacterium]MDH3982826.1 PDZ domain-containing protein [Gammaproteobacteria bacterium]
MPRIALVLCAALLVAIGLGTLVSGLDRPKEHPAAPLGIDEPEADTSLDKRLQDLEQALAEEREARIALEDTLAMLFEELDRLEGTDERAEAGLQSAAENERQTRAAERRGQRNEADWVRSYQERRIATLVEGGFSDEEARHALQLESEASFKAMQLAWEAQRNGESIDVMDAVSNPQSILRAEMGDDAYARYLAAQGQPTAIRITQVLGGSPANDAGLRAGDELISYNGERVFNVMELRNGTMQGQPGEDVVVEIERDGVRMQLTLPRGPIGITGSGANVRGMNWWGG